MTIGTKTEVVLSTTLAERVADTLSLFALSGIAIALEFPPSLRQWFARELKRPTLQQITWAAAGLALLLAVFFWIGTRSRLIPARMALRKLGKSLRRDLWSRYFAASVAVATVTWLLDAGTLVLSAKAGGAPLSLMQAMACIFVLNIGIAIPLTVANVGVFEASMAFALGAYGLGLEQAIGVATAVHAIKLAGSFGCLALFSLPKAGRAKLRFASSENTNL